MPPDPHKSQKELSGNRNRTFHDCCYVTNHFPQLTADINVTITQQLVTDYPNTLSCLGRLTMTAILALDIDSIVNYVCDRLP